MTEADCHPVGAVAFAEARGQETNLEYLPTEPVGFGDHIVHKMVDTETEGSDLTESEKCRKQISDYGQGWPGGCAI